MRISVVVSTYNRAAGLRETLASLRLQTYSDFEVVVVNGPSTDGTDGVLAEFAGRVRACRCPHKRLAISRNTGIAHAAGEVVAFIDDDAVPEPTWLEELAAAHAPAGVGAAGGLVLDHTGAKFQYRYAACTRAGVPRFDVTPPFDPLSGPHADPFVYLQGTNMSFKRAVLAEMGGFDENILHYYDDVEAALRVHDLGYKVVPLDGAAVHHKYLASHVRDHQRVTLDPFNLLSDQCYFALRNGRPGRPTREVVAGLVTAADLLRREADDHTAGGRMTPAQRDHYRARVEEALEAGLVKGTTVPRADRAFPPADPAAFRRFPAAAGPAGGRLKLCFVSREYPPGDFGGVGRYTAELAGGFAAAGHEVHVVTHSPAGHRVDLEAGVWVHRVPAGGRWLPDLDGVPLVHNLAHVAGVYQEVCRIHERGRPLDLVSAPLWLCEGLAAGFDDRFPTVVTLMTCMKAIADMHPSFREQAQTRQLIALEEATVARAGHIHAISHAILARAAADYGADPAKAFVVELGLRDRRPAYPRSRRPGDGRVRVLFVGRLEVRKGADLFLEAAAALAREFPAAEFVLAGKDTPHTELGETYRERFEREHAADPDLRGRVTFAGMVTEDELFQHYADADVFCLPSRYESFGLVFVEAMMFGLPVVGVRAGGMAEVIADGEYGLLAPADDADGVTAALRALLADPARRADYGRRARAAYEARFAEPVVVARTEAAFRGVIARHRPRSGPAPVARVARGLAQVVATTTGLPAEVAARAADRLLDPTCFPVDPLHELRRAWHLPDDRFVVALYDLFLGRGANQSEVDYWVGHLRDAGGTRAAAADALARASADGGRLLAGCLAHLPEAVGAVPAAPAAVPPAPARRPSVRHRVSRLPLVGKAFQYVRRLVFLPWNFHKFYHGFGHGAAIRHVVEDRHAALDQLLRVEVLPALHRLARDQEEFREAVLRRQAALAAEQREQRDALDELAAGLAPVARPAAYAEANGHADLPDLPVTGNLRATG